MTQVPRDEKILAANLAALALKNPLAARTVRDAPDDDAVAIQTAKDGELTLTIDGRHMLSHYAPRRDAERLAEMENDRSEQRSILTLGFELGYLAAALLRRSKGTVYVVEPRVGALRAALAATDLTALVGDPRLRVVTEIDRLYFQVEFGVGMRTNVANYILPSYRALYADLLPDFQKRLMLVIEDQTIILKTTIERWGVWFDNLIGNTSVFSRLPSVARLRDRFRGRPAVIVAAGPSLEKNIHLLPQWKNRGVIVAVGTALRRCVAAGVVPDITVALESNDILSQFDGIPRSRETFVTLFVKCHRRLWDVPARGRFFFGGYSDDVLWLLDLIQHRDAALHMSGSVATAAFSLAAHMGCGPLVIIGQDLAFGDTGRSHAGGVAKEGEFNMEAQAHAAMLRGEQPLAPGFVIVPGYHGGRVLTRVNLRNYLMWFETNIPNLVAEGIPVINATEGGARIRGTEQMPFAAATDLLPADTLDIGTAIEAVATPEPFDREAARAKVAHGAAELRELAARAKEGVRLAGLVEGDVDRPTPQTAKNLAKLETVEKRLAALAANHNRLLTGLAGGEMQLVKANFDYAGKAGADGLALNMRHAAAVYEGVERAARRLAAGMEELARTFGE